MALNIVDIIATIVFLATVVIAFKKGFVAELKGFLSQILSLVIAYIFAPVVAEKAYSAFNIGLYIKSWVTINIDNALTAVNASGAQYTRAINEGFNNFVAQSGILRPFLMKVAERSDVADALKNTSVATKDMVIDTICKGCEPYVMSAVTFISFILILIVAGIVLRCVLTSLSGIFSKIAILGFVNNLLGGVIGVFKGAIAALITVGIVYFMCGICKIELPNLADSFYLKLFGIL